MTAFTIHARRAADGVETTFSYDNQTSMFLRADGTPVIPSRPMQFGDAEVVSVNQPGRKGDIKTLKISLGLSCNYECGYCSQRFVPHAEQTNPGDVGPFVAQLTASLTAPPARIEFWGGEPFVYWKTLKPLAEALRALYPAAHFNIITNGSLLDLDKNAWLVELGFSVGLSHDGPGYHARGADPLDDPEKLAAIMDLWARLKPLGRMSVNAMMHRDNQSRANVQAWLQARFGNDVPIGEGAYIDPYDEGGMAAVLRDPAEHMLYRARAFTELRQGRVANFSIARQKIQGFVDSIRNQRPASSVGQKCGMDKADNLAVDLAGNVITCQNVSAKAVAPNGQAHKIGHLSDLPSVQLKTATHWSQRRDCAACPVLQLCQGSCMFLEGPLWEAGCDSAYSDNVPFFAAAIEFLTGCTPYYIEGEFRDDRKDLFGRVRGVPAVKTKRVIEIHAVPA
jgi:uncharacterized protein